MWSLDRFWTQSLIPHLLAHSTADEAKASLFTCWIGCITGDQPAIRQITVSKKTTGDSLKLSNHYLVYSAPTCSDNPKCSIICRKFPICTLPVSLILMYFGIDDIRLQKYLQREDIGFFWRCTFALLRINNVLNRLSASLNYISLFTDTQKLTHCPRQSHRQKKDAPQASKPHALL